MIRDWLSAFVVSTLGAAAVLSCAFVFIVTSPPVQAGECSGQVVRASWYGTESGNRTANGEHFDGTSLTAAHRTLPFGTRLRVTYKGQTVLVRINDRGPYSKGRSLDLSREAAQRIGMIQAGVGLVCLERLG
jgi:rare lipoprotein A